MKSLLVPIILLFIFLLQSCATVSELVDPNDQVLGYKKVETEEGKTEFKRKRLIDDGLDDALLIEEVVPDLQEPLMVKKEFAEAKSEDAKPDLKKKVGRSGFVFETALHDEYLHIGPAFRFELDDNPFTFKLGVSLFSTQQATYAGFDLGSRWNIYRFGDVEPLVGVGLYAGDRKECEDTFEDGEFYEECTKSFLTATYLELGLRIKDVTIFAREYGINDAGIEIPVKRFLGIGIGF